MISKKNTSYRSMLRDRVPMVVDAALKWCKAKECWVNHVYDKFVNIYADKEERYHATRIALGISGKYHNFDFHKTIFWEDLNKEETENWESVEEWVYWFQQHAKDIKKEYDNKKNMYTRDEVEMYLTDKFLSTEDEETAYKLIKFIIDTIE